MLIETGKLDLGEKWRESQGVGQKGRMKDKG